jgi:hypothetical protein
MAVGTRALEEGYAVSYIPCSPSVSLDSPLDVYRVFAQHIQLPGEPVPGLRALIKTIVRNKRWQIEEHQAPDPNAAFERWLRVVRDTQHPENSFGRVIVAALREAWDPDEAPSADAAIRWLQGDIDTLTKDEREELRLAKITNKAKADLGRNLLLSMIKFVKEAGASGVVLLFDEVETLFTARGKALLRVLSAMRVLVDLPTGVTGGVPLFGVFSAVPDILNELNKYPALQQRLAVLGAPFDQGNDFAAQLSLDKLDTQEHLLAEIGKRLLAVGEHALDVSFDRNLQEQNAVGLARVAAERSLEVDSRRLYVKAWVNLLNLQAHDSEKRFTEKELAARYQGYFDDLKGAEPEDDEP